MNYLLAQLVLARKGDFGDWANILFVVVLGIFWAIGGILKARANKSRMGGKEEEPADEPVRKPPQRGRGVEEQPFQRPRRAAGPVQRQWRPEVQQRRGRAERIQPAVSKPAAKVKEPGRFPSLELPEVSKLSTLRRVIEEPQELIGKPKDRQLGIRPETAQPEAGVEEPVLDFDDPEKLRRAILHYEILGKPLSLREQSGHIA